MNYKKLYKQICKRGQSRQINTYTEQHHIIPKSLGGDNSRSNLTDLTAREHFICHWLLVKFSKGDDRHKMLHALRLMKAENPNQKGKRYSNANTSRVYESIKVEYAKLQSQKFKGEGNGMYGKKQTQEAKDAISKANTGRIVPLEERKKVSDSKKGKKRDSFSDEWKENMSKSASGENNSRFGKEVTKETRKKIGDRIRGRKQTQEEIDRRSEARRGQTRSEETKERMRLAWIKRRAEAEKQKEICNMQNVDKEMVKIFKENNVWILDDLYQPNPRNIHMIDQWYAEYQKLNGKDSEEDFTKYSHMFFKICLGAYVYDGEKTFWIKKDKFDEKDYWNRDDAYYAWECYLDHVNHNDFVNEAKKYFQAIDSVTCLT